MNSPLKNLFYPSSVCVPGASSKEKSIGYELLRSIKSYGFKGSIYPVNPNTGEILGIKCYPAISDIPGHVDSAIVAVPNKYVEDTIDELLSKGVKTIILITAGFKEVGGQGGRKERQIAEKIKAAGGRLVGPNCMGVISTLNEIKLNATFVAEKPEIGSTAFLSQSGAIGAAVLNSLRDTDIKFAHFISVGNKADVSELDMLRFWTEDKNIKTITMYLESFEEGESFVRLMDEMDKVKPLIILKAGRSEAGKKAALSHTGALGTSDKVVDAILNQFGVIRAETLNDLFNTAKGFENFPVPAGKNVAIVTNAGGPAILAADSLEKNGLRIADLSDETKTKLRSIVRPEGSVQNPVDLLPGGTPDQYKDVINILINDIGVDSVISIFVEPVMVSAFDVVEKVNSINKAKPVMQAVMPLPEFWEQYRTQSVYKKPLFKNPEDPAKVISNILFFFNSGKRKNILRVVDQNNLNIKEHGILSQQEMLKITSKYNIPVPESVICQPGSAAAAASKIGYPLAVKGLTEKINHKSDAGAVFIGIKDGNELEEAEQKIENNFSGHDVSSYRLLLQKYIKAKHELVIGGLRDNTFGPVVMFGTGGKYIEVLDDVSIKSAYLTESDIDDMIASTKIGKILKGVRGETGINPERIKNLIRSAAQMLLDNEEILEFDFNPVIVTEAGDLFAVDLRMRAV